eukprot:jgi/Tetstr1/421698/TSEL_012636.t1
MAEAIYRKPGAAGVGDGAEGGDDGDRGGDSGAALTSDENVEDSEEEGQELELTLDEHGRVAGTSDCGLHFSFSALRCPLEAAAGGDAAALLPSLRADCASLFGAEESFWLPAGAEPRCALECLAADVFRYHTRNLSEDFDLEGSGAEWWVQVRDTGVAQSSIGFHWDKDEDLVDSCGLALHPQLSTVTYLSAWGAPTVACERRAPVDYGDDDALHDPAHDFVAAFVSYPACEDSVDGRSPWLKHIAFDGRLLHGLCAEAVTFPLLDKATPCAVITAAGDPAARFVTTFGPTGTEHELSFGAPLPSPGQSSGKHICTVKLDLSAPGAEGRVRASPRTELYEAPTLAASQASWDAVREAYARAQLLVVRGGALPLASGSPLLDLQSLLDLYAAEPEAVEKTWNVEFGRPGVQGDEKATSACSILAASRHHASANGSPTLADGDFKRRRLAGDRWYVSFVLNESKALTYVSNRLPFATPPCFDTDEGEDDSGVPGPSHTANVWFFFGRNGDRDAMPGRPEHTDKITHHGTWHAQQAGSKVWHLRPDESDAAWTAAGAGRHPICPKGPLRVDIAAGDLLLVNTRLWYHRTEIPSTVGAVDALSLSYARDFFLGGDGGGEAVDMSNCDDTWATQPIGEGTEIVRVDANDDAQLASFPTSDDPNCRILAGPAGEAVIVAARDIQAGESLTLPAMTDSDES